RGLQRFLLTMLDGLESASAERVCVMMTAMNPADLPAAVVRSGRIELWLEMRLPDRDARAEILRDKLAGLPAPVGSVDVDLLATASRGMTGADLKSAVEDGKLSFAQETLTGEATRAVEDYFLEAFERIRKNKRSYRRPRAVTTDVVKLGFQVE